MLQNYRIWSPLLWITALHLLGMELISRRRRSLHSMVFPPFFDNLALQLMFSHFFLATLSFTITFSIGQTSQNLGHCFVWSNLLLKCKNITQLKREIVKVWREIHADKDLLRRLMSSIPKRCRAVIQSRGDQIR